MRFPSFAVWSGGVSLPFVGHPCDKSVKTPRCVFLCSGKQWAFLTPNSLAGASSAAPQKAVLDRRKKTVHAGESLVSCMLSGVKGRQRSWEQCTCLGMN